MDLLARASAESLAAYYPPAPTFHDSKFAPHAPHTDPYTYQAPHEPVRSQYNPRVSPEVRLPEVGQTRCYWTLLSSSLQFLVLDPVLTYHLRDQAGGLVGRCLLEFVHPDEQESARRDLNGILEDPSMHGSVTRVRYCRLSQVRRQLGFVPSENSPPFPPSFPADRIAMDDTYMAVDLVINCAAGGIILCFIHAVVDLAPREDNDPSARTGWSNWCGTCGFGNRQAAELVRTLDGFASSGYLSDPPNHPPRAFQILINNAHRDLLVSWPTDAANYERQRPGIPSAVALARLAQGVEIKPKIANGSTDEENIASTSCTRRYRVSQDLSFMEPSGMRSMVHVESIFIPHGEVIFACHKIEPAMPDYPGGVPYVSQTQHYNHAPQELAYGSYGSSYAPEHSAPVPQSPHGFHGYASSPTDLYQMNYGMPSGSSSQPPPQHTQPQSYAQQWVEGQLHQRYGSQSSNSEDWRESPPPSGASSQHDALGHNLRHHPPPNHQQVQHQQWPGNPASFVDSLGEFSAGPSFQPSPGHGYQSLQQQQPQNGFQGAVIPSPISPLVPLRDGLHAGQHSQENTLAPPPSDQPDSHSQAPSRKRSLEPSSPNGLSGKEAPPAPGSASARTAGAPPSGVIRCTSCKTTTSPEWRKGPSGKKELCNACGLRYARSRAKKEGVAPRRRKDRLHLVSDSPATDDGTHSSPGGGSSGIPLPTPSRPLSYLRADHDNLSATHLPSSVSPSASPAQALIALATHEEDFGHHGQHHGLDTSHLRDNPHQQGQGQFNGMHQSQPQQFSGRQMYGGQGQDGMESSSHQHYHQQQQHQQQFPPSFMVDNLNSHHHHPSSRHSPLYGNNHVHNDSDSASFLMGNPMPSSLSLGISFERGGAGGSYRDFDGE